MGLALIKYGLFNGLIVFIISIIIQNINYWAKNSSPFLDFSDFLILCKNNKIKKVVIYNNFLKCFLKDARHPQKLLKDIASEDASGISPNDVNNISKTNDSTALVINSNDNTLENSMDDNPFPHQGHWKDWKNDNPSANGTNNGIIDGIGQRHNTESSGDSNNHRKDQTGVPHNDILTGVGKCQNHSSGNPHGLGTEQENQDIITAIGKGSNTQSSGFNNHQHTPVPHNDIITGVGKCSNHSSRGISHGSGMEQENHDIITEFTKSPETSNHDGQQQAINTNSANHCPSKDHHNQTKTQGTNNHNHNQSPNKNNKDPLESGSQWPEDSQFIKSPMAMDKMEDLLKLKNAYMVYFPKNYFNFVEIILPYTKINFDTMGFLGDYFWIYYFFPMMFNKFDNGK